MSSTRAASTSAAWQPPPLFSFPPLFTLQPVDTTRAKQLEEWRKLILSWSSHTKQSVIPLRDWPLWENKGIGRRLNEEGIRAVAEYCVQRGSAEWADADHASLRIFYRTPAEWASLLYTHLSRTGYGGQLLTVYELHSDGAVASGTPWEGLEAETLMRSLEVLEAQGKVDIIRRDTLDECAIRIK